MLQSHIGKVRIMPDGSTTVPSVAIQSQKNTKGILNNGSAVFVHTMKVSGVQKGHKSSMPLFTLKIINQCMNRLY